MCKENSLTMSSVSPLIRLYAIIHNHYNCHIDLPFNKRSLPHHLLVSMLTSPRGLEGAEHNREAVSGPVSPHLGLAARSRVPTGCGRILPLWRAAPSKTPLPCDDKLLFFQLTVRGQRSVGRPQADVDRDEDEEDREEEDAGCRGGHSKELHPPTAAQPPAAGTLSLPGGAALPWEPRRRPRGTRVYYRRIDPRGRGPHPPAEGRACSSPPSRVREKQSQTTARSANCKCLVSVGRRLRAPLRVEVKHLKRREVG
ncbi:uncharacterized protein [Equus asinus]|uniref:uncharacterized protein n=1 Tax=Equus asinus TaxID=9793 RepID=UPI0038F73AFF